MRSIFSFNLQQLSFTKGSLCFHPFLINFIKITVKNHVKIVSFFKCSKMKKKKDLFKVKTLKNKSVIFNKTYFMQKY